jgi:hypothetical protein
VLDSASVFAPIPRLLVLALLPSSRPLFSYRLVLSFLTPFWQNF